MAFKGTNWIKRKDIEYMTFMANELSKETGKTIGIYEEHRKGVGKIFDFEEVGEKEYIKTVRFDKQSTSRVVLSDNEGTEPEAVDNIRGDNGVGINEGLDEYSGGLLQEEQSNEVSDRPKQSNKDRNPKKRN